MLFAAAGFTFPLLAFTNLHMVHNYYQYANSIFLVAAVGFGVASIAGAGRPALSFLLVLVLVAGEIGYFRSAFAPLVTADYSGQRSVQVGAAVKQLTQPGEAVLVLGDDWSSEIPFYGERKALVLPYWSSRDLIAKVLRNPSASVSPERLGAVVFCADRATSYADEAGVRSFAESLSSLGEAGGCQILAPPA